MHFLARPRLGALVALVASTLVASSSAHAQSINPFYAGYTFTDLGSIAGVPPLYGGINFALSGGSLDLNTLIIGGNANTAPGSLYSVPLIRNAARHIVGFGAASFYADAAFNDGGVTYGPGNVLFLSRWPSNEIGETKAGSTTTDKVVNMASVGIPESTGGLTFVPGGFLGSGQLKYLSWPTGLFYTLLTSPDGSGTFDITGANFVTTLGGGPEGFAYVPLGSSGFAVPSMIVAEYSAGSVATYELDSNGDPIVATRRPFMDGLTGAEGSLIDPVTGDFLFSTFGGGDRLIVVQGFQAVLPEPSTLLLMTTGLLVIAGLARRRRAV